MSLDHLSLNPDELRLLEEDPVKYAQEIYKSLQKKLRSDNPEKNLDTILNEFQSMYPQFTRRFPIVLRYMVQMGQFSSKAFAKFVAFIKANAPKTKEEWLDTQAVYPQLLYKMTTKHYDTKHANLIRKQAAEQLREEFEAFQKASKSADELVAEQEKQQAAARRRELLEYLLAKKDQTT
jgi:DNA repair exonuclease SbcCD nuclease subunit